MMLDLDATWFTIVAATFFVAGIVKGVIGLGLPTIAMGLLGALVAPAQAAAMLVLPTLLTNVWQMADGPYFRPLMKRLWPMFAGVLVGTLLTSRIIAGADTRLSTALLGTMLITYAASGLAGWRWHVPQERERLLTPLAGMATGLLNGATAIFVLPTVPYLQGIGLEKDELVQGFGMFAFAATCALGFGLGLHGALGPGLALPAAGAVLASFAGMSVGRQLRRRLSIDRFRRWVFIGLIALGASMIHRGLR